MDDIQNTQAVSLAPRSKIILINLGSLMLVVPGVFILMLAAGFASDSPEKMSDAISVLQGLALALPVVVFICILFSQIRKSERWANAGVFVAASPLIFPLWPAILIWGFGWIAVLSFKKIKNI